MTREQLLLDLLSKHGRIGLTGYPKTGKTTISNLCTDRTIVHTDDFLKEPWANVPSLILTEIIKAGRCLVEGVQVARVARKSPQIFDAIIIFTSPHKELTLGQEALGKGVEEILLQVKGENPSLPLFYPDQGAA